MGTIIEVDILRTTEPFGNRHTLDRITGVDLTLGSGEQYRLPVKAIPMVANGAIKRGAEVVKIGDEVIILPSGTHIALRRKPRSSLFPMGLTSKV